MLNRKMLALIGIASFCGSAWLFAQKSTGKALTAQDLVDIQQLYAKYNWTLDSGDAEAYASTFTPDGVFNNNVGHDAIVDVRTQKVVALESLLRWHHPTYGLVPTERFISVAEETGLIQDLAIGVRAG